MFEIHGFIIALIIFVLLSAFFSASETGMMSLNRYRLLHLAQQKHRAAQRVAKLLQRPDRLLGIILLGNTLATIMASAVATVIVVHTLGNVWLWLSTIILTLLMLIFAETAPKTFAANHPEKVAFIVSAPLLILLKVLYPVVWVVNALANSVLRVFRVSLKNGESVERLSAEELRTLIQDAGSFVSANYQQMLLGLLDLEKMTVDDVMVPRQDIYGIDLSDEWSTIEARLLACEIHVVPVYQDSLDQVLGMLHLNEVLPQLVQRKLCKADLQQLLHEAYYIPEGSFLPQQLRHFRQADVRLGLVVDEYGDIQGLVSLQDMVEEIIGQFADDVDELNQQVLQQTDGSYLVDASVTVRDFNRLSGWHLPTDEAKTLNGLCLEALQAIPEQQLSLRVEHYTIEVKHTKDNTISQVQIWPAIEEDS